MPPVPSYSATYVCMYLIGIHTHKYVQRLSIFTHCCLNFIQMSTMINASNDMDSSVMISSVNLLSAYNLAHLGVMILRMNSDGVNIVCMHVYNTHLV